MPLMRDPRTKEPVEVSEAWIKRWPDDYLPYEPAPAGESGDTITDPPAPARAPKKRRSR